MVTVYSTINCKYCKLAKLFLQANDIDFEYKNIDTGVIEEYCCGKDTKITLVDNLKEEFDELGAMGAPVIVTADGEVFRGFTPDIQKQLAEKLGL